VGAAVFRTDPPLSSRNSLHARTRTIKIFDTEKISSGRCALAQRFVVVGGISEPANNRRPELKVRFTF
jgi:hypothetical protein